MKKEQVEKFTIGDGVSNNIREAVAKMTTLVGMTMGPLGRTVIIPDSTEYGKYKITKDGVSVAKTVHSKNKYQEVIMNLMREVAKDTVREAGDGTTTSIMLMGAFVEQLSKIPMTTEIRKLFEDCLADTITHLNEVAIKPSKDELEKVALISANGDKEVAELISKAYGQSKVVHVNKTTKAEDSVELLEGLFVPTSSMLYKHHTPIKHSEADVLVLNVNVNKFDFIKPAIVKMTKTEKPLLIIADHVDEGVLRNIKSLITTNNLPLDIIKSPGFSSQRTKLLEDIAIATKAVLITEFDKAIKPENYGTCKDVTLHLDKTVIGFDKELVKDRIKSLEVELVTLDTEHQKDLINQRLDRLKGISIINVGGQSEIEITEKFDRFEDAVRAVSCALSEGIVEGGGLALAKYAASNLQKLQYNPKQPSSPECLFYLALIKPLETLVNLGLDLSLESDLTAQGIYDPVKVTKTALIKAFNFTKVLTSTGAIIL